MRIALAWGWSGWHVFPIQSLVKYIVKTHHKKYSFVWFWEKPSLEYTTRKKLNDTIPIIDFIPIVSGKWRREKEFWAIMKNIRDILKLKIGFFQSLWWLYTTKCDIIFCKWWYVSLPVVIAWWVLRKNIFLHESDTKPGLSNRICSKFATVIFTWFEGVFPGKEVVVWQILDDDLVDLESRVLGHESYKNKTNILVTGGSQWAESVYKVLDNILSNNDFSHCIFHVILWTKNSHSKDLFVKYEGVIVYDFVDQKTMWALLELCDVAITRGGTTSLAEEHLFGIKKIIIPIPRTHDQLKNGLYYKDMYGDIVVRQDKQDFSNILWKEIIAHSSYKKGDYKNPLAMIQQTKQSILQYFS